MLTIEMIREFLEQNKDNEDVKAFILSLAPQQEEHKVSVEEVNAFLETDEEGKKLIQSIGDKRVTDALKTYKDGHFSKEVKAAVAAELLKINPTETPEQKRIREVETQLNEQTMLREKDALNNSIKDLAFKEKVDPEFISSLSFNSLEEAGLYIKRFKGKIESIQNETIQEYIAKNKFVPGKGDTNKEGKMTFSQYRALPQAEREAMVESGAVDNLVAD